ncbi:peptide chain release factor N(5)-glutamine methyltransferase [Thermosulfuriphilus sp.]
MPRIEDLLRQIRDRLQREGIEEPQAEADFLLAHFLGLSRAELYFRIRDSIPPKLLPAIEEALRRRLRREPLAYILEEVEFYGRRFQVGPGALIPRPETEILVETILKRISSSEETFFLDLGTGSGVIAITLAIETGGRVLAIDKSLEALKYAQKNVARYGLEERVFLVAGNWCRPLKTKVFFDVIVSNPPYVSHLEWSGLAPEIRHFEPQEALLAEEDGLSGIKAVVACAQGHLKPRGLLACEIGSRQAEASLFWAKRAGLLRVEIIKDFSQNPRLLIGYR